MTKNIFIDRADFSENKVEGFFGVMPGQVVCLRYGPFVRLLEIVSRDANGQVDKVKVEVVVGHKDKVPGVIHWVSKEKSIQARVNLYQVLLTEEDAIAASA